MQVRTRNMEAEQMQIKRIRILVNKKMQVTTRNMEAKQMHVKRIRILENKKTRLHFRVNI